MSIHRPTMKDVPGGNGCDEACANQNADQKQHNKACEQRAASELDDEQLYRQGHKRPEGDFCPICTLPISLPMGVHSVFFVCCMKKICNGCIMAAEKRDILNCPFCRTPRPKSEAESLAMVQTRVEKKDPAAINYLAQKYCHGNLGLQKDMRIAVELWTEAAELGSIKATFNLGYAYCSGDGVQKDEAKGIQLWSIAALQGHVESRHNLGCIEGEKGYYDLAVRHLMILAEMGFKDSVETIQQMFMGGLATEEQLAQGRKGYQDAVEKMKSHDRDEARALGNRNAPKLGKEEVSVSPSSMVWTRFGELNEIAAGEVVEFLLRTTRRLLRWFYQRSSRSRHASGYA
ncbi:hypothetical protein THAOC_26476 [Thalassiosira oceanica]|uniref:RING-type domain-containing protein n=1 Tax=Thalassiosira oceanica TaxID=159749 RepID=K0RNX4_THAOC|nr:hypothetical protein THAOC_26476 [Thalassiosira oceanica]|eukprot:EJK53984.1 hypothetical protein THAOC_26476 [Thalassiosira oceanica]